MWEKADLFFVNLKTRLINDPSIWWGLMVVALLLIGILYSFEYRIDIGGDNAAYVQRAYRLLKNGKFPSFQGPLYPMVLSLFINLDSIDLVLLKSLSGVFLVIHHVLFLVAFKKRIDLILIVGTLILVSLSHYYLFFGSETYSEAFFLFIQGSFLVAGVRLIGKNQIHDIISFGSIKDFILPAVICLALGLTRSIGFSGILAVIGFFILERKYKNIAAFVAAFITVYGCYKLLLMIAFDTNQLQFSSQASQLLLKNPYDTSEGYVDFHGLLSRFIANSEFYLGYCLPKFTGIVHLTDFQQAILSWTIWLVLFVCLFLSRSSNNKPIMLASIYCIISLTIEFVILQDTWMQYRLVIPYYPIIMILAFYVFYEISIKLLRKSISRTLILVSLIILGASSIIETLTIIRKKLPISQLHKKGYDLAGYTPDIQNYIKMSRYVAENLSEDDIVYCRKPSLSFLYSSREFGGIYRIPDWDVKPLENRKDLLIMDCEDYYKASKILRIQRPGNRILGYFWGKNEKQVNPDYRIDKIYCMVNLDKAGDDQLLNMLNSTSTFYDLQFINHKHYLEDINYVNPSALLNHLLDSNIDYLIVGSLRSDPNKADGRTISTIKRQIRYIELKYPGFFELVHTIGKEESSYLYRLDHDYFRHEK